MEIIKGKIPGAKKIVIYGPSGIGKTTLASCFPDPLFIDTEGSTKELDVARTKPPSSWTMLLEQIEEVKRTPSLCRTLVIDTIDWAEQMCIEHICDKHQKNGLESFSYGSGYVYVKEEFGRFLNKLSEVVNIGIHVVLTAHAQMRKFEQPDEMGAYDRWELKLGKKTSSQTSPLVKEWSDMLLFANYKTFSVAVDDKGKKHKAQGGKRVMYTAHHPCWDAKNRYGLPDEIPMDYGEIAHIIESAGNTTKLPSDTSKQEGDKAKRKSESKQVENGAKTATASPKDPSGPPAKPEENKQMSLGDIQKEQMQENKKGSLNLDERIPEKLRDLMLMDDIDEWSLENAMVLRGFIPEGTNVRDFDAVNPGITDGLIVPQWKKIVAYIAEMKENQEVPFD